MRATRNTWRSTEYFTKMSRISHVKWSTWQIGPVILKKAFCWSSWALGLKCQICCLSFWSLEIILSPFLCKLQAEWLFLRRLWHLARLFAIDRGRPSPFQLYRLLLQIRKYSWQEHSAPARNPQESHLQPVTFLISNPSLHPVGQSW